MPAYRNIQDFADKRDNTYLCLDLLDAQIVELLVRDGKVWLNVDGMCVVRVKSAANVLTDLQPNGCDNLSQR